MLTVGVDLAAEAVRTAVAWLAWSPGRAEVTRLAVGVADDEIVEAILRADKAGVDCPIGWPSAFVAFVTAHHTGHVVTPEDVAGRDWRRGLAFRHTDMAVRAATGLVPLSVAADRIAYPAMRCAGLLARLAQEGRPVDRGGDGVVVEVYPAASLKQWGLPHRGYKRAKNLSALEGLVDGLQAAAPWLDLGPYEALCRSSDDAFDAVIASLTARAAAQHLTARPTPEQATTAAAEGWIAYPTAPLADLRPLAPQRIPDGMIVNISQAAQIRGPMSDTSDRSQQAARPAGPLDVNRRDKEMAWSGIQTFLKAPVCLTPEDLRAGGVDVAIGGAPWDGTATGLTGAHLGPRAIRQGDYITGARRLGHLNVRVDPLEHLVVADYGDADILIGNAEGTYDNIRTFVAEILSGGAIPIILGGDHGITWPSATAVADAYGHGTVGIVHFDAHADTAPDMRGSLHGHGTPMRRLIESGAVPGRNFVQVGLRGYWPEAPVLEWMEQREMRTHFMAEIHRDGFAAVLERAVDEALDQADHLYISLDVDVCDPAYTPGTGTPEPGGLTSAEVLWAVRRLAAEVGMVGMDVVEVSPPYDSGPGITALFARRAVMEALTGTAMRRLGLTQPDHIDPRSAGTGG